MLCAVKSKRQICNFGEGIVKGEDFLYLIMQHVLPKGFRRVRDYGFLHGNATKLLFLVQLVLQVVIQPIKQRS